MPEASLRRPRRGPAWLRWPALLVLVAAGIGALWGLLHPEQANLRWMFLGGPRWSVRCRGAYLSIRSNPTLAPAAGISGSASPVITESNVPTVRGSITFFYPMREWFFVLGDLSVVTGGGWEMRINLAWMVALSSIACVWTWWPRRVAEGCPACGYSLAGLPAGARVCPECGGKIDFNAKDAKSAKGLNAEAAESAEGKA